MEKKNEEMRKQTPSEILRDEKGKSEYNSLFALLDILESVRSREEYRPTYTSYFINMKVNSA